ncbi:MAG TPA: beta-ketoacyl synthase N-terminal-like domain-containing protein, partial [Burkholderiales bacterium]
MQRVVVTGMGIVSCLGNDLASVSQSLARGRSGIRGVPSYVELGLRSQIAGTPQIEIEQHLDRRDLRFMGDAAAYSAISMKQAIADSGLQESEISHPRTGLIAGSGGASTANVVEAADILRARGVRKVGATRVPRTMSSTVAACLATTYHIKGVSYSITSAC